jgi:chorismate mutase
MTIYEDILTDFFKELDEDAEFPKEIRRKLEILLENKIKSDDIVSMIKKVTLDGNKD